MESVLAKSCKGASGKKFFYPLSWIETFFPFSPSIAPFCLWRLELLSGSVAIILQPQGKVGEKCRDSNLVLGLLAAGPAFKESTSRMLIEHSTVSLPLSLPSILERQI
jgi:hypothetical protein